MRVTDNLTRNRFSSDIASINERVSKSRIKYTSGEELITIGDNPEALVTAKKYKVMIERNKSYSSLIKSTIEERNTAEAKLETISGNIQKVRDLAIESTHIGNTPNFAALGDYVKGLLKDMLRDANGEHNGKYLFAGTKTTPESISAVSASGSELPFELIEGAPTATNPSGITIEFNGNNEKRVINRDDLASEEVNSTAAEAFGGTSAFDSIIQFYNMLKYNSDGTARGVNDSLKPEEITALNTIQKNLASTAERINSVISRGGEQILRFESIGEQMANENARLDEYRSRLEDADVARAAVDLTRDENALQYALQAGAGIAKTSLFDFLR
ncbi:MAG: hypothetical protein ACM3U1_01400 [Chloroflexota bacterium]